ncbi:MAG TPA: pyrimidine/purine nucleoside phosphorylase [Opitutales bacterium]|nr:pyrimidine/purine nucleoside phosphorylase [Opitutales bacterium]
MAQSAQFDQVSVLAKANVYFDGKVVSHTVIFADGSKKTLGLIYPGSYHFGTQKAERMELVAGSASILLDGTDAPQGYDEGTSFDVPANSGFTITVADGICEYICSYIES